MACAPRWRCYLGVQRSSRLPIATLTLVSQPGDFVGGDIIGNTYGAGGIVTGSDMSGDETLTLTYPAENLYLFGGAGDDLRGAGTPSRVSFDFVGGATFFVELTFQTDELGVPMQPGIYANAEEVNFDVSPGHPGLYVYGHSGCSTITGEFDVTDASFLPDDTVSSFSASFEQHCEGETPALFGTFTYNANAPTPVPEPAGYSLVGIGIVALVLRRFERHLS